MESIIYQLIKHLGEHHKPRISLIDEDYGQLENLENDSVDMYPLTFPAILIELTNIQWSSLKGANQQGMASIRIRLILDCYDDTHRGSQTESLTQDRARLYQEVHRNLQGFRVEGTGGLMRLSSRSYTWSHGIKVYETTYQCQIFDEVETTMAALGTPLVQLGRL